MFSKFIAYDLALQLHDMALDTIAPTLRANLRDQLERATQSIVLNLAEGSGKPTLKDQKRFYAMAFGSTREVKAIFHLAKVTDTKILDKLDHTAACLFKLTYR